MERDRAQVELEAYKSAVIRLHALIGDVTCEGSIADTDEVHDAIVELQRFSDELTAERDKLSKHCENQRKALKDANDQIRSYKLAFHAHGKDDEDVLYNGGGAKDWYGCFEEQKHLVEGLERRNVALADEVAKLKSEVIRYAGDCLECETAMPKGVSWPRWSDGSLVEFGQKLGGMAVRELSFSVDGVKIFGGREGGYPFTLANDVYCTTYEKDEGLA